MRSTLAHIKEFKEGFVWQDIKERVAIWAEDIRDIQNSSSDPTELFRCQGRLEAINFLLLEPEIMEGELIEQKELEKKEDKNG